MPRGGHGRGGRAAFDVATRKLHATRTRPRHRVKGAAGAPMVVCDPPPGLSRREKAFWNYYAPALAAERRLTLKARDALATYCTARAIIADLRAALVSRKRTDLAERSATRKELRQWVLAARLYENDLLLNPASAIRAPLGDVPPPIGPGVSDPFDEFDDDASIH